MGSLPVAAQTRAAYFDQPARVVLPDSYSSERSYPLLVFLPFTTGTAEQFFERHRPYVPSEEVIVLLPPGRPQRDDYLPDFIRYIGWYEQMLLSQIEQVAREYSVDRDRIALGGFSLGGDLTWALMLRNPDLLAGAVMAGTRTSYPADRAALERLRSRNVRAAFYIGDRELTARISGIQRAYDTLQQAGIASTLRVVDGAHVSGPAESFARSMLVSVDLSQADTRVSPVEAGPQQPAAPTASQRVTARNSTEASFADAITVRLENASDTAVTYLAIERRGPVDDIVVFEAEPQSSPFPPGARSYIDTFHSAVLLFGLDGESEIRRTPPLRANVRIVLEADGTLRGTYSDWGY